MPNHWLFDFYAGNSLGILALNAIYRASVLGATSSHFKQVLLQRIWGGGPTPFLHMPIQQKSGGHWRE